jgi:hypothetical protein
LNQKQLKILRIEFCADYCSVIQERVLGYQVDMILHNFLFEKSSKPFGFLTQKY